MNDDPSWTKVVQAVEPEQPQLKRVLGPGLLLLFIVGDILGTGIYALTGQVAAEVGGAAWLPFLLAFAVATVTAFSYLELVTKYPIKRPNLRVLTKAPAERILFEGKRATGIRFRQGGQLFDAFADAEVLLTAGAINSPRLLEASGVGSPSLLAEHGIPVVHANAAVGENLQDHLQVRTVFKVHGAKTLNTIVNSPIGLARIGLEYALKRTGPMSMAPSQFGMFTKSDPSMDRPDLEYHVQPLSTDKLGDPLHRFPAITVSVVNLRPDSVGSTHLVSRDLAVQPEIRLNYLTADRDRAVAVASIKQARRIMATTALRKYRPEEVRPGPAVVSDEDLAREAGNVGTTIFHPVGTCKMGDDERSVVGPDLRVHGIERLRVIDASIMPKIVSGNTASPVVMIAEKAADMIRQSSRHGVGVS
ncbi:hypothetical protein ASD23_05945 [Agromyces sp. Root1464]|uniref:GMC family oxidoreductase n=1 Tax=Agromyces sp. Root1464 TaxID=1736467 RepID=UPI0006FF9658|nr:GMC oxidoreductase [Agromyces sp. Root1464]KQZ08027.1 hypothetical protein ASD23_05945 [Agromyces sp. Root1464]